MSLWMPRGAAPPVSAASTAGRQTWRRSQSPRVRRARRRRRATSSGARGLRRGVRSAGRPAQLGMVPLPGRASGATRSARRRISGSTSPPDYAVSASAAGKLHIDAALVATFMLVQSVSRQVAPVSPSRRRKKRRINSRRPLKRSRSIRTRTRSQTPPASFTCPHPHCRHDPELRQLVLRSVQLPVLKPPQCGHKLLPPKLQKEMSKRWRTRWMTSHRVPLQCAAIDHLPCHRIRLLRVLVPRV
mmetsp:Transcript_107401/g.219131  ORF Transcript_107401/g.219131 Transcript_107401/m.219131 type:complete len:244 (+) Transcript_107401:147-878(+)